MIVWVVMKEDLETGKETFEGVFTSKGKAQKYIENTNESGDCVEYGITMALLDKVETKINDELIESLQTDRGELTAWLDRCALAGRKLNEQDKEIKQLQAQVARMKDALVFIKEYWDKGLDISQAEIETAIETTDAILADIEMYT